MSVELGGRAVEDVVVAHAVDVDPHTGAASIRIAVPCPPGRSGFGPSLTLVSGAGGLGSPFGHGWALVGVPAVGIDLRRRAPRYDGADDLQLAGEAIVPALEKLAGAWSLRERREGDWRITLYRGRRTGRRTRIEQWTDVRTGRVHFRSRDARGTLTIYGARPAARARIADPADEARTFSWLPELQIDRVGNAIWFDYAAEDREGVDRAAPFEPRVAATAQRYLKRIRYGNATPLALDAPLLAGDAGALRWHFDVVLDYGDHAGEAPANVPDQPWLARRDPSTTHRPGFAVRTHRLCRRLLWFHDFDMLGSGPTLVGALALDYDELASGAMLRSVREHGYRRGPAGITTRATPSLQLRYAAAEPERAFRAAPRETLDAVSGRVPARRFVDLWGDGLPGILTQTAGTWLYQDNLGEGRFAAATVVLEKPAVRPETFAVGDLDGNGDVEVAQLAGRLAGRFELPREDARWRAFEPFAAFPHVEALGGRAQWADLNGDGRPDVIVAGADRLIWFASDGDTFAAPVEVPLPSGASAVPASLADPALHLFFADMTGDGVADLVRVDTGGVTYWPMLGNGRFGEAVVMEGVPSFGDGAFDPARVRLVDLDGTGTTDLVYLGIGEVTCWINAAGNRLEPGPRLGGLPQLDNVSAVSVLDVCGDGRPCLVWTNPLPGHAAIEYLPLTTAVRPRAVVELDDSRGKVTRLSYASAAAHYLRDRAAGTPWRTRLPDHPIVVDRLEVIDQIGGSRSIRRYAYHDGYFDGEERELRGFGRVDIRDDDPAEGGDSAPSFSTPSLTRMWFHLGTPMWNHHRPDETYTADVHALPAHVIDDAEPFGPGEIDDGLRSLAGQVIRTEVWSLVDGTIGDHPLSVQQRTLAIALAQPRTARARPAFEVLVAEELAEVYEQAGGDPRVTHELVLATDAYGTPTRTATIAYPRRTVTPDVPAAQSRRWIAVVDRRTLAIDESDRFELDLPVEVRRFELVGVGGAPPALVPRTRLRSDDVAAALATAAPHHRELADGSAPTARLLAHAQTFFWDAARTGALPLGAVGRPVLAHHEEAACFAHDAVTAVFGDRVDAARLRALGYVERDGAWWRPSPVQEFAGASGFYQLIASVAYDGGRTEIVYDDAALVPIATIDAVGNRTRSDIDYHALGPWRVEDANGAVAEVDRDPLGVVVASTRRGHVLDQPWGTAALSPAPALALGQILADPAAFVGGAAHRLWYDTDAWSRDRSPIVAVTVTREALVDDGFGASANAGAGDSPVATSIAYVDGFGRTLQTKIRVEPGPAIQRGAQGSVVVDPGGQPILADALVRWRVSGHAVVDTRQRVGRTYEPYFSSTAAYEGDPVVQQFGVSMLRRYDALGRLISIDQPDGSFSRVTYRAWDTEHADPNDTVEGSAYLALRAGLPLGSAERQALDHARRHADTPERTYLDPWAGGAARSRGASRAPPIGGSSCAWTSTALRSR